MVEQLPHSSNFPGFLKVVFFDPKRYIFHPTRRMSDLAAVGFSALRVLHFLHVWLKFKHSAYNLTSFTRNVGFGSCQIFQKTLHFSPDPSDVGFSALRVLHFLQLWLKFKYSKLWQFLSRFLSKKQGLKGVESRSWKVCGGPGDGFFLKMKSPGFPFGLGVPPLFHDLGLATVLTQTSSLLGFNLSGLDKRYHHS